MKYYESKYTGAEVDALLGQVESGEVGGKVTVDSALSTESENPVMNRVVTAELGKKADTDGVYPDLIAGDLAGHGESVPAEFSFRASGGKSIKDGRAYIKRIKGNSVVWNQLAKPFQDADEKPYQKEVIYGENNSVTIPNWNAYNPFRFNIDLSRRNGHKFLTLLDYANDNASQWIYLEFGGAEPYFFYPSTIALFTTIETKAENLYKDYVAIFIAEDSTGNITFRNLRIIDLTQMFGAGDEPTTIEEFYSLVPSGIDLFAYNEGKVIHCNTESIKSVGDNAWDEQWRLGFYVSGQYIDSPTQICSKNPIKVLPNESYCINQEYYYVWYYDKDMQFIGYDAKLNSDTFVTPSNAAYIHFNLEPPYGTTYKNDIIVTLVHSGWKQDTDAGYQEYWEDTLPLPIIRKYFPQGMKSAGSAYDVIDCKKKQAITNVGVASNLSFSQMQEGVFYVDLPNMKLPTSTMERMKGIFTNRYAVETDSPSIGNMADKSIIRFADGNIYIKDMSYTNADEFNTANADLVVCYELAEPMVAEITEDFRDYYKVADFGTEQTISSVASAPFSADIIYQFNAVDMIREHELEITQLQNMIATMQAQLASLTSNNA